MNRIGGRLPGPGAERRDRSGFSLIEIMVAMTILSVVLLALGALTIQTSKRSTGMTFAAQRNSIMTDQMNQMSAWNFDQLPGRAGCTTVAGPPFARTQCIAVTDLTPKTRRIRIIVTPALTIYRADTVFIERTKPPTGSPLKTS